MKKARIAGILIIALAIAVAVLGFVVEGAKMGDGAFAGKLVDARAGRRGRFECKGDEES